MSLLTAELFYGIIGAICAFVALRVMIDRRHPRRKGTTLFWALLAVVNFFGPQMPPAVVGYLVLGMVLLAATGRVQKSADASTGPAEREASAQKLGNKLFWPALVVPVTAVAGSLLFTRVHWGDLLLLEPKQATLISLGLGALLATLMAMVLTRENPLVPLREGSRLLQTIGWALILPQLLAALGGIFSAAGMGDTIAELVTQLLPVQSRFMAVAAYAVGMAVFTICLGNAFAAFPVMTLGIGLPLIVHRHHGNPAIMAAIGMLSGYCGTLLTPMAANFNIVPAMLLELRDRNAIIKAQAPAAVVILAANILIMYLCVYRF